MKLQQILEMPERIAPQELDMPWQSIDLKQRLWVTKLKNTAGGMLAAHPLKTNRSQQAIVAYVKTEKGHQAAGFMLVHPSTSAGRQCVEVAGLSVLPQFRGSGLAYDMYVTAVFNKGLVVVSDDVQTPGDAGIWRKLTQHFPKNIGVTDEEVDAAVPVSDWTDGDPFTHTFTRLVFSPAEFASQKQAA